MKFGKNFISPRDKATIRRFSDLFYPWGVKILKLAVCLIGSSTEARGVFKSNSEIKHLSALLFFNHSALTDDTGLCVDILDKKPKIIIFKYKGHEKLLSKAVCTLQNLMEAAIVFIPLSLSAKFLKRVPKEHIRKICKVVKNKFGYASIFIPSNESLIYRKVLAEEKFISSRSKQVLGEFTTYLRYQDGL